MAGNFYASLRSRNDLTIAAMQFLILFSSRLSVSLQHYFGRRIGILPAVQQTFMQRYFHTSTIVNKVQSGRYKITINKNKPLTYEMANPPHYIAHRKSWNSWNTSNIKDGNRPSETALEDMFIRQFMWGTWPNLFVSEIIIKRQHNIIRIAGIITRTLIPYKIYFLTGYTEELLSYWLQCPVKVELVTIDNKKEMIFKYV